MTATADALRKVYADLQPDLKTLAANARTNFMARFGAWIQASHRARLEQLLELAAEEKLACFFAGSSAEAAEHHDIFETYIESIDTLGMADRIIGEAEARLLLKQEAREILNLIPVAAGFAVRAALPLIFPGPGNIAANPAGSGVEWLLGKGVTALEDKVL